MDGLGVDDADDHRVGTVRTRLGGALHAPRRSAAVPAPARHRRTRRRIRNAPHRLAGAALRNRLLVPHVVGRQRLCRRSGRRNHALRVRETECRTRGDPHRQPEHAELSRGRTARLQARRHHASRRAHAAGQPARHAAVFDGGSRRPARRIERRRAHRAPAAASLYRTRRTRC